MKIRFGICSILMSFLLISVHSGDVLGAGSGAFRVELPDAGPFGMGSAFIGEADRASAVYYNPAGITQLDGNEFSFGGSVVKARVQHTNISTGIETDMRINSALIPHVYLVTDLGLEKWSFGFGTGSNWGTKTDWAEDSFAKYVSTTTELISIDSVLVAAYEATESLSVAAGLRISAQDASLSKQLPQDSGAFADASSQLKGDDTSFGYTLSMLYRLSEEHQFGLQYRSAIEQKLEGKAHLHGLQGTFAAVFGSGTFVTDAFVELEMPQIVSAGYSYKPDNKWTFNLDVEWTDWSGTEELKINYPSSSLTANQITVLNTGNPAVRDWNSVWSAAIGVEYAMHDDFRVRGGYYWHESPIPDAGYDTSLPDADSHGLTAGLGYDIKENIILDLAYSIILYEDRRIDNAQGSALGGSVDGDFEQHINLVSATITYNF